MWFLCCNGFPFATSRRVCVTFPHIYMVYCVVARSSSVTTRGILTRWTATAGSAKTLTDLVTVDTCNAHKIATRLVYDTLGAGHRISGAPMPRHQINHPGSHVAQPSLYFPHPARTSIGRTRIRWLCWRWEMASPGMGGGRGGGSPTSSCCECTHLPP